MATRQIPEVITRLTEAEFDQVFGGRLAQAIGFDAAGKCVVNSALTRTLYVAWDWAAGKYVTERRAGR